MSVLQPAVDTGNASVRFQEIFPLTPTLAIMLSQHPFLAFSLLLNLPTERELKYSSSAAHICENRGHMSSSIIDAWGTSDPWPSAFLTAQRNQKQDRWSGNKHGKGKRLKQGDHAWPLHGSSQNAQHRYRTTSIWHKDDKSQHTGMQPTWRLSHSVCWLQEAICDHPVATRLVAARQR